AILGFTDILRRGLAHDDAERQEYLGIVHSSGQNLLSLINDILDLSKIEAGRLELELARCSPHQLLFEVASTLRVRAEQKGISLDLTCQGPLPETIETDPTRWRQILINLVGNAIKFTEQGGVRIEAALSADRQQPRLSVRVID